MRTTATDEACSEDGCPQGGFTLVEMLVAIVILALIMVMVLTITDQTSKLWKRSSSEIQAFQNARAAYDTMTMRLSQATLNTYLDYYNTSYQSRTAFMASTPSGTFTPTYYARNSDLDFVVDQATTLVPLDTTTTPAQTASCHPGHAVFFEAPLGYTTQTGTFGGLVNMLNACGYYVEFNTDKPYLPPFLSGTSVVQERYRYRLMEFLQPTENNTIYSSTSGTAWFTSALPPNFTLAQGAPIRMLAENIVALAILPEVSPQSGSTQLVTNSYTYDARAGNIVTNSLTHDQLPPLLRVVMVAIDEPSAIHLNPSGSNTPPTILSGLSLFKTTTSGNPSTDINTDLNTLTQTLASNKVNYRVFDTDVAIRGAKWSTQ